MLYFKENEETAFLNQLRNKDERRLFFDNLFLVYIGLKDANFQLKITGPLKKEEDRVLNLALKAEAISIAKFFIENGATINSNILDEETEDTFTVLSYCAYKNFIELVDLLVMHRADINALSSYNRTAIQIAAEESNWEVVKKLLNFGAKSDNKDDDGNTLLYHIIQKRAPLYTIQLVCGNSRFSSDIFRQKNKNKEYPLHIAAQYLDGDYSNSHSTENYEDNFGKFKWLWENFKELRSTINSQNKEGKTALMIALSCRCKNISNFLIDQKEITFDQVDTSGNTVLHHAVSYSTLDFIKKLLSLDKNNSIKINTLNYSGNSAIVPLLSESRELKDRKDILDYLVKEKGLDVNNFKKPGNSPLFESFFMANGSVYTECLIENGAKLGNEDGYNGLLLHCIADNILATGESDEKELELLKKLINLGGYDPESKDEKGKTLTSKLEEISQLP